MSYASMVALGDSFTEGLEDEGPDGRYRGWADLVAGELATRNPEFRYANLAVRGRRLARIRDEQVPRALAMQPDLVTLSGGGNDIIGSAAMCLRCRGCCTRS
jgi:lysophospholipase L1-like esterase